MSEKFTPGEWETAGAFNADFPSGRVWRAGVIAPGNPLNNVVAACYGATKEEAIANATLMHAAKDLFARLKLLVDTIEAHEIESLSCDRDGNKWCECLQENAAKAKSALAKARVE